MNVYEKLQKVQERLVAPKNRKNSFGNYNYRNCEDILESCKPLLAEYKAVIILSDYIEVVGERTYVKAVAQFIDIETGDKIENQAYAREALEKRGMDDSQITGTASSYCRKYCLNGLLAIDDQKDADSDEYQIERETRADKKKQDAPKNTPKQTPPKQEVITEKEQEILKNMCATAGLSVETAFPKGLALPVSMYADAVTQLQGAINAKKAKK